MPAAAKNQLVLSEKIKVISIRQPYADDVFFGGKWAENRSWRTNHKGELWIHASSRDKSEELTDSDSPTAYATGFILGRVNMVRCVARNDLLSVAPQEVLEFFKGPNPGNTGPDVEFCRELLRNVDVGSWRHVGNSEFVWLFAEPEMLDKPIKISGKVGFWYHTAKADHLLLATRRRRKWALT